MAYIGKGISQLATIDKLDNITLSSSTSYNLTKDAAAYTPIAAENIICSIDGVVQYGNFTISGSTIDFTGATLSSSNTMDFIFHIGETIFVNPPDDSITASKIVNSTITNDKLANYQITINGTAVSLGGSTSISVQSYPTLTSATPNVITNDAANVVLAGTNFVSIPKVSAINTATGIWYEANSVSFTSSTSITANFTLPVDGNTYRIRVENPDGGSVLSTANFLTVSDAPTFTTSTGSLGSSGNGEAFSFTVAATGDTPITYSKISGSFPGGGSIESSTGVISGTETGSTTTTEYSFTIRATDAQSQTVDRAFAITITHGASGGGQFN